MVWLPDGGIKLVNIELEPNIIKEILNRCENNGFKINAMRDAYNDTLRELGNLTCFYDDPDQIITELENKLNEQFTEKLEVKKREAFRRIKKRNIIDSIEEKIETVLDSIEQFDDVNVNVNLSDFTPKETINRDKKEGETIEDLDIISELIDKGNGKY